jgi:hypothetical protein
VTSRRTQKYKDLFAALPEQIKKQAIEGFSTWKLNPHHPSLRFKKVHAKLLVWSARINDDYRSVGILRENVMVWYWVGKHSDYEKLLKSIK